MMPAYTNAYKGRPNRQESASHLVDEFERIEAAFVALQNKNSSYIDIYNYGDSTEYILIDPSNGQMQEITLTRDSIIEIVNPGSESDSASYRLTLIVHGANFKIINGWGPQTWKDQGNADWMWIYTGAGDKASAVLEFAFDKLAWCCLAYSRNSFYVDDPDSPTNPPNPEFEGTTAMFPLLADLWNVEQTTVLTWARNSYGWGLDIDATFVMVPENTPRFYGGRYVKNWIATPSDLQSVAWEEDNATVTTEAGEGQDGGDVDKITFDVTNGEVKAWMLLHFGRASESADPIKFVISFDAKMAGVVTAGTCRAVISIMGVDSGAILKWDREEFAIDNAWNSYGAVLDPVSGKDLKGLNLNTVVGARTLVKFAIESPSDGVGNPILIENVNVVILKEGDDERPSLPVASSIGSSLTLSGTAGSTGTWVDGTKTMSLSLGESLDFQDSLDIGKSYLCVARKSSGSSANVLMENDRTYWTAYSKNAATDSSFVSDAPFVFQYEGGVFKFKQVNLSSEYIVNIYEVNDYIASFGTVNANVIAANKRITYTVGDQISSNINVGVAYEYITGSNLLPLEAHRNFRLWDQLIPMRVFRSEYGIDGRPSHGSVIEDASTANSAYISEIATIANDSEQYTWSIFVRKTRNSSNTVIHESQFSVAAGGPVTSPSSYVDFKILIYDNAQVNSANWIDGELLRLRIKDGSLNVPSGSKYGISAVVDYQNWWHVFININNNGTGNDRAALVIFPAAGTFSQLQQQVASRTGYMIVDWAQFELSDGFAGQTAAIPGELRGADAITTVLNDGILLDTRPVQVGDVTGGVFFFNSDVPSLDSNRGIAKYITWNES